MSALPLLLIKGTKSLEAEKEDIVKSIEDIREKLRATQEKYQKSHQQVSRKDAQIIKSLKYEER